MENVKGVLKVDFKDLLEVQKMLNIDVDLKGCIKALFITSGQEPTWVKDVKLSFEPKENLRPFAEKVLQEIKDYIELKKNE